MKMIIPGSKRSKYRPLRVIYTINLLREETVPEANSLTKFCRIPIQISTSKIPYVDYITCMSFSHSYISRSRQFLCCSCFNLCCNIGHFTESHRVSLSSFRKSGNVSIFINIEIGFRRKTCTIVLTNITYSPRCIDLILITSSNSRSYRCTSYILFLITFSYETFVIFIPKRNFVIKCNRISNNSRTRFSLNERARNYIFNTICIDCNLCTNLILTVSYVLSNLVILDRKLSFHLSLHILKRHSDFFFCNIKVRISTSVAVRYTHIDSICSLINLTDCKIVNTAIVLNCIVVSVIEELTIHRIRRVSISYFIVWIDIGSFRMLIDISTIRIFLVDKLIRNTILKRIYNLNHIRMCLVLSTYFNISTIIIGIHNLFIEILSFERIDIFIRSIDYIFIVFKFSINQVNTMSFVGF